MHIRQSIGSFSCSSVSFMNDDFVLYWATSIKVVFSCVLEIELQSTRVYMHKEEVSEKMDYLVGVGIWWTRGRLSSFLDDSSCNHLSLLGWNSGATFAEVCLHLEADWSKSGWTVIITFFIDGNPLQKRTSGAVGRKWNGSPLLATGSGPSCCCKQSA